LPWKLLYSVHILAKMLVERGYSKPQSLRRGEACVGQPSERMWRQYA